MRLLVPFMLLICLTMQGCSHGSKTAAIYVPDQSVSDLFKQLQSPQTTDPASDQLESLAESDPRIRNYLTERIPALIVRVMTRTDRDETKNKSKQLFPSHLLHSSRKRYWNDDLDACVVRNSWLVALPDMCGTRTSNVR
jgi:hypothetical protein